MSPLLFAIVVGVVTDNAKEGLMKKVLYADDLVLMSETIESLKHGYSTGATSPPLSDFNQKRGGFNDF